MWDVVRGTRKAEGQSPYWDCPFHMPQEVSQTIKDDLSQVVLVAFTLGFAPLTIYLKALFPPSIFVVILLKADSI
jgi:hypothetical protein